MDFVKHKLFGIGEVVSRKGNCLIVKFEDNSEKKFAIPQSFQLGILTAEGDLKKEVDDAIKVKEELAQKRESEQMLEKAKIERIKKSPKKAYQKENIAFKCNYCDGGASALQVGYAGVCSKKTIEYNIVEAKRTWCSSEQCECHRFLNGEFTYNDLCQIYESNSFLCYESGMLINWKASAGTDVKNGKMDKRRKLKKIQKNSLCILTTVYPNAYENERIIFGVFLVDESYEGDYEEEGYVTTNSKFKLKLTSEEAKQILFWNYHKNSKDEQNARWSSGLYRYVNDITSAQILRDIATVKKNTADETLANEFFEHYCKVNNIDINTLPENNGARLLSL